MNYPEQMQGQFNNVLRNLNNIINDSTLIDDLNKFTISIKQYNHNHYTNDCYRFKKEMENMKEQYDSIQADLSSIQSLSTENLKSNITDELSAQMRDIRRCLSIFIQEQKSFNGHIEEHIMTATNASPVPLST
ncbi:unnamed protein product [Rotaria sp. Silwood2]|nr:unnamed protein product [Rotaria sp. Silwood2]CAF2916000.1 unnamed protein product [Rotaria sp. Silwood2]CAF3315993.1 unnamed protein product [Rotaria sp. Silwood2]CAF4265478.1 unnamed protein product [Rotaria sp. Silwood2]CAF4482554.1 unnamed protein product [Rotaria sp. Silwood2]